jgi:hypothetical protein
MMYGISPERDTFFTKRGFRPVFSVPKWDGEADVAVFENDEYTFIIAYYDGGGAYRYVITEFDGTVGTVKENDYESLSVYLESIINCDGRKATDATT